MTTSSTIEIPKLGVAEKGKWSERIFALVCASLIPFGAHYMKHGLGPLKPFFVSRSSSSAEDTLDLSHTDFGVFLAVNAIL